MRQLDDLELARQLQAISDNIEHLRKDLSDIKDAVTGKVSLALCDAHRSDIDRRIMTLERLQVGAILLFVGAVITMIFSK